MKNRNTPLKKWRREDLSSWLTHKSHHPYYCYLDLLNKSVKSVFKEEITYNPHKELTHQIKSQLKEETQELFTNLIQNITLLNHTYRVFTESDGYESSKEDVLSAAKLLQLEINPESMLWYKTKMIYWELEQEFGIHEFGLREAGMRLLIPKGTIVRHIKALENAGYIKHTRTDNRRRFYYEIV